MSLSTAVAAAVMVVAIQLTPAPAQAAGLVTPSIAGVVSGNTRIDLVNAGFAGSEGPLGLSDGSLVFAEPRGPGHAH